MDNIRIKFMKSQNNNLLTNTLVHFWGELAALNAPKTV